MVSGKKLDGTNSNGKDDQKRRIEGEGWVEGEGWMEGEGWVEDTWWERERGNIVGERERGRKTIKCSRME